MNLGQKLKETTLAIGPVMLIVVVLHVTVAPLPIGTLISFLIGAVLVIFGLAIFLSGADLGIVPAGSLIGAGLTRTRNLPAILISIFITGFIITLAEPNLKVQGDLVESVTGSIKSFVLVASVSLGIGFFLMLGMSRILLQIPFKLIIIISYTLALLIASQANPVFVAIAFDSSGAATGPLTVPFFIALGIGVSSIRGGKNADDDSFGTTGIAAIGPILAMTICAFVVAGRGEAPDPNFVNQATEAETTLVSTSVQNGFSIELIKDVSRIFLRTIPKQAKDVLIALTPLAVLIGFFQKMILSLPPAQLRRIAAGLIYAWIGLILFFVGANTGFIPAATLLGQELARPETQWILIPLGCVLGALIVCAEPAMWVLTTQVEEVSSGNITKPILLTTVAIGVAAGVGLAMWRVLAGFSIWYLIAPLFITAMLLTLISPKLFAAIAFDSGSVATGPVSSTLILPITLGAAMVAGGNPAADGFGLIAMIAITPPISIQILGILYNAKEKKIRTKKAMNVQSKKADNESTKGISK